MDNVEYVRDITDRMADRDFDLDLVQREFADDFVHHANGVTADKATYLRRGQAYRERYVRIDRPTFDELVAVGADRVLAAYTLQLTEHGGQTDRVAVMALWTIRDGKVAALREVDGPVSDPGDV
jgi:ketosteroid isomerase-like protein